MRIFTMFLLSFCLAGPAIAQNAFPGGAPVPMDGTKRPLTRDGKIQIGYDKRADYPLIKQQNSASSSKTKGRLANTANPQDLDGDIYDPYSAEPVAGPATAPAPQKTAARKIRSDSALKGDSAAFKPAAEPAPTPPPANTNNQNSNANNTTNGNTTSNNGGSNTSNGNSNNTNNNGNNNSPDNGFAIVGGKRVKL